MTKKKKKIKYFFLIILSVMSIFIIINNCNILKKDNRSLQEDSFGYFFISKHMYKSLQEEPFTQTIKNFNDIYFKSDPPMIVFQAILLYPLFGATQDTALLSISFSFILIVFGLYFLGEKIINVYVGFFSAFFVFFIPGIRYFSRNFNSAIILSSFIILSALFLLHSKFFKKRNFSILFGISFALGMMTKITFFIYITPLIVILILQKLIDKKFNIKNVFNNKRIKNIFLSLIIIFLIISPWYFSNINKITTSSKVVFQVGKNIQKITDVDYSIYYILLRIFLIPTIIGIIYFFITENIFKIKKQNKKYTPIIIWIISCILILKILPSNNRYIVPLLPLMCIIIGGLYFEIIEKIIYIIKKEKNKSIIFIIFTFVLLTFLLKYTDKNDSKFVNTLGNNYYNYETGIINSKKFEINHKNIHDTIQNLHDEKNITNVLMMQFSHLGEVIKLSYREGDIIFHSPFSCEPMCNEYNLIKNIDEYDLIIDSDINFPENKQNMISNFPIKEEKIKNIFTRWQENKEKYELIKKLENVPLYNFQNGTLYFYIKKNINS